MSRKVLFLKWARKKWKHKMLKGLKINRALVSFDYSRGSWTRFNRAYFAWYHFNGIRLLSFIKTFPSLLCGKWDYFTRCSNECKILVMNSLRCFFALNSSMISLWPQVIYYVWFCFSNSFWGNQTSLVMKRLADEWETKTHRLPIKNSKTHKVSINVTQTFERATWKKNVQWMSTRFEIFYSTCPLKWQTYSFFSPAKRPF
jgi:hypothetical protein